MKKLMFVAAMALMVSLTSCTNRLVDFTVISTKSLPLGPNGETNYVKGNTRVTGKDITKIILTIPIGSPNLKEAIDKAIESTPGAVGLADGVVKSTMWWALLFGENGYVVEGTPIYDANYVPQVPGAYNRPNYNQQTNYNQQNNLNQGGEAVIVFHDVKKDDTMAEIAKTYGCTIGDIIKWNQLSSTTLTPGTKLKIYVK